MSLRKERHFFNLIVNGTNKKQNVTLLKSITKDQLTILKKISADILQGKIILKPKEYNKLVKHKTFIRNLGAGKATKPSLTRNYSVILDLLQIGFKKNEISSQTSFGSIARVGKNKRKKLPRQEKNKYESDSSENSGSESGKTEKYRDIIKQKGQIKRPEFESVSESSYSESECSGTEESESEKESQSQNENSERERENE